MSLYTKLCLLIAGLTIYASCGGSARVAKQSGDKVMKDYYTGRSIDLKTAVQMAQEIIIGRLVVVGDASPGAPGQSYYADARVQITRWVRTDRPKEQQAGAAVIAYTVQTLPVDFAEREPQPGELYLMLLTVHGDGTLRAIKILPADDPEAREVEEEVGNLI